MVRQEAVDRLRTLGVFTRQVAESAEIFERYGDVDGISEGISRPGWTVGTQQFIYFHLGEILKNPDYRAVFLDEAQKQLRDTGVRSEHIEEYFQSGADPSLVFSVRHGEEYDRTVRSTFVNAADAFALRKIRGWLGFE
ncbi:MAG TPA: hypothetical protein VJA47_03555 [archaeon]|nr:hypothetical protein [archaeon]